MHAARGVEVGTPGNQEAEEVVVDAVQAHAELLGCLVDHRSDVDVLAEAAAADQVNGDLAELVVRERQLHHQRVGRLA